jgi:hypothetical protein
MPENFSRQTDPVPEEPVGPVQHGPVGPGSPGAPGTPRGPAGPLGPEDPVGPLEPVGPVGPVALTAFLAGGQQRLQPRFAHPHLFRVIRLSVPCQTSAISPSASRQPTADGRQPTAP